MRRSRQLPRAAVAVALVAVALAGCVGIPSSGGVNSAPIAKENKFAFTPIVYGPKTDASREEILTDFMQAATSPEDNYNIARSFLTKSAAAKWVPTKSVLIRDGAATLTSASNNEIDYSALSSASVNEFGLYSEEQVQGPQQRRFTFAKVGGQWRINTLDDGTVLTRDNFQAVFSSYALYFFDPTYHFLIPDIRWFPARSNVPTRIVSALLTGQAGWLQQGATLTAFPQGTQLATVPVAVKSGVAIVDFSDEAGTANTLEKARMLVQLKSSLGLNTVSSVSMTVRGAPLVVGDQSIVGTTLTPSVNPLPLVRVKTRFGFAGSDGVSTLGKLGANVLTLDPKAVTLGRGGGSAAVLNAAGVSLVTDGSSTSVDKRSRLIPPTMDNSGFVWSVPARDGAAIRATGADGHVHSIATTIPAKSRIVSFQVSHDGARALAYYSTAAGPRLEVAAILRRNGVPTGLGDFVDLPTSGNEPIDATWQDDRTIATLSRSPNGDQLVTSYPIGGPSEELGRAAGGVRIVGGDTVDTLRVLTDTGNILQRRASGWQGTGLVASLLATQQ
ncbi:MAG: hypothetical protein QOI02_220 [Actinomycetota bacterium]|nr:hypothetical protein [Actinomycetota bacterium]